MKPDTAGTTAVQAKRRLVVQVVEVSLLSTSSIRKKFNNGIQQIYIFIWILI